MFATKQELNECLQLERQYYCPTSKSKYLVNKIRHNINIQIWSFQKSLRKAEYYFDRRNSGILNMILFQWNFIQETKKQQKLGMEIGMNVFAPGLQIFHPYGIVVNGDAKVGKNCMLHGANVIGNMGTKLETPVIGDNVRLGAGAKVLGGIKVANDVKIGAGAVVLHSCETEGALLVGIPAKVHEKSN